jgi:hypothetical protein
MSDQDAAYTSRDWKPLHHRIEPLRGDCGLLLRVMLVQHRRERDRAALLTEVLARCDCCHELESQGGTTMELRGVSPEEGRKMFEEVLAAVAGGPQ